MEYFSGPLQNRLDNAKNDHKSGGFRLLNPTQGSGWVDFLDNQYVYELNNDAWRLLFCAILLNVVIEVRMQAEWLIESREHVTL